MTAPSKIPPGWYADQNMVDTQRYWDGTTWTDRIRPMVDSVDASALGAPLQPTPSGGPMPIGQPASGRGWGTGILLGIAAVVGTLFFVVPALVWFGLRSSSEAPVFESEATAETATGLTPQPPQGFGESTVQFPFNQPVEVVRSLPFTDSQDLWLITVGQPFDGTESLQDDNPSMTAPEQQRYLLFDIEMSLLEGRDRDLTSAAAFDVIVRGGNTGADYRWTDFDICNSNNTGLLDFVTFSTSVDVAGRICVPVWDGDADHPATQIILSGTDQQVLIFSN